MTIALRALTTQERTRFGHRDWSAHIPLAVILLLQAFVAVLALRGTAFMDEALYIYAGQQIDRSLLGGPPPSENYATYFSGHPYVYPVLAGFLNALGGLETVRLFSTLCMLVVTGCVFWITRRCFDQTSAVAAALLFAFQGPTLFLSHFATYDALCLALLGIATVLAIQVSTARDPVAAVVMGPILVLAVGAKYAALLFVPAIIGLMALRTVEYWGWKRAGLHVALTVGAMTIIALPLYVVINHDFLSGMFFTTTNRSTFIKTQPLTLLGIIVTLGGLLWLLGGLGVLFTQRSERRFALALLAASLLAPAYHLYTGEIVSLQKHVAFGMFFVAPLAGYTLNILASRRVSVRLDLRWVASVLLALITFIMGMSQAQWYFKSWPDSSALISTMRTQVRPVTGRYLCEDSELVRYALQDVTAAYQITGMGYFEYTDVHQRHLTGQAAYIAAITEGHFSLIELSLGSYASLDNALLPTLQHSHQYRLIAKIPYSNSYGTGNYYLWRKQTT